MQEHACSAGRKSAELPRNVRVHDKVLFYLHHKSKRKVNETQETIGPRSAEEGMG